MAINLVKGEIKIILETLSEQYDTISKHQEKIPQIELDIIMANIRKLYERFYDLNNLNGKFAVAPPAEVVQKQEEKQEKEPEIAIEPVIEKVVPEIKDIAPEPLDAKEKQDLFEEIKIVQKEEKPVTSEPPKKTKTEKNKTADLFSSNDKEIIADKFKESPKSVYEKISVEKGDKTMAEKISKSSKPSLKSAIGINDKFLFINQLFKGDLHNYNKAIDKLNACDSIELATGILEDLRSAHNWENGDETYQKLEDLVIRKFL